MIEASIEAITEATLQQLIIEKRAESRRLEYKRELWSPDRDSVKEMLADITAFANTDGGDLVIGMEEDRDPDRRGIAFALPGIDRTGLEQELDRIEKQLRDAVDPRLPAFTTHQVSLANGRVALVMRVPASIIAPHRAIANKSSRFTARDSRGVDCRRDVTRGFHREVTHLAIMFRMSGVGQDGVFSFRVLGC